MSLLGHRQVEDVGLVADAVVVHHVELGHAERRGDLVLHHFRPDSLAGDLLALLDLADPPHVDAAGGVELQRPAAGRGLGIAEHHADLLANLVDENHRGLRLGNHAGQLSHRLAHEPGLQPDVRIADLAFEFLLWHQRGDGVDDDDIDGVALDEHFGDVHGLFAGAGLADQEGFQLHAEFFRPGGIQGVFGVDESGDAAVALVLATTCRARVVLPLDSGPKISTTRPQGMPWPPRAMSNERLPVEMPRIGVVVPMPSGMMAPSPNSFSICTSVSLSLGFCSRNATAPSCRAVDRVAVFLAMGGSVPCSSGLDCWVHEHANSISFTANDGKGDPSVAAGETGIVPRHDG